MPRVQATRIKYDDPVEFSVEIAVDRIENLLAGEYNLSKRAVALLLLQDDEEMAGIVKQKDADSSSEILDIIVEVKKHYSHPMDYIITMRRQ